MDVFEALSTTRAMRRVRGDPIPPEHIARIIDAAIRAPAGGGRLRVRFVAVTDDDTKGQVAGLWQRAFAARRANHFDPLLDDLVATGQIDDAEKLRKLIGSSQYLADHLAQVPLVLFAFGRPDDEASVFPAMWSACLAARALGVGSTFTRILVRDAREEIEQLLRAPSAEWMLHGVIPMGYPLGRWDLAVRPPATEACFAERWGQRVSWSAPARPWGPQG